MFKNALHFIILAFFRRISNRMNLEYYDFRISVNGKKEKIHVMITKKFVESEPEQGVDLTEYLK